MQGDPIMKSIFPPDLSPMASDKPFNAEPLSNAMLVPGPAALGRSAAAGPEPLGGGERQRAQAHVSSIERR
jgi:hypothetical protein